MQKVLHILSALAILLTTSFLLTGCGASQTQPPPTVDVDATIEARVQATIDAKATADAQTAPTAAPTDIPAPTPTTKPKPTNTPVLTSTPTTASTPEPPTNTPAPTATPTVAQLAGLPPGDWAVRTFNTDDASVILVNGEMMTAGVTKRDLDWTSIDDYLKPNEDNIITVANWNARYGKSWGFSLRRDDTVVWGSEGVTGNENSLNYAQTLAIKPDGSVEPLPPDTSAYPTLADDWSVRIRDTADVGVVLVNGVPVAGAGNWGLGDTAWIDISGLLHSDQDNTIRMYVWNFDADFAWWFSLRQNDTTVWEQQGNGAGPQGVVYQTDITISSEGEIVLPKPVVDASEHDWAMRTYYTDDASVILVNGEMVTVGVTKRDLDWTSIDDYLKPNEDNIITVANWNARYGKSWGFSLRRDDTVVWGSEGVTGNENSLNYAQTLAIKPDGSVEPLPPDTSAYPTLSDDWSVRIRDTADVGVVLVNGIPVAGAGNWGLGDTDWIDISGLLRADQDNAIRMYVWNFDADYAWRISVRRGETTVWESERNGGGLSGVVFDASLIVTPEGEIVVDN